MIEAIKEHLPWLIPLGGFIGWLFRLEARATGNSAELVKLAGEMNRMETRLEKQRAEDIANQQHDWDQMSNTLREMRADIKTLLQRDK